MATLNESNILSDVILSEHPANKYSRDAVTLISGQNLAIGAVLGKITIGAATSAVKSGGNTGNGTLTMDATTPILANAQPGVYTVRVITASANAFTARVTAPDGDVLGDVSVSGAGGSGTFSNQIKFAIVDGATDFIVGDGFDVTIAAGSGKVTAVNFAAIDGSAVAFGVLGEAVDASLADVSTFAIVREAIVKTSGLVWPSGASAGQKAAALDQLAAKGVIARTSY